MAANESPSESLDQGEIYGAVELEKNLGVLRTTRSSRSRSGAFE